MTMVYVGHQFGNAILDISELPQVGGILEINESLIERMVSGNRSS